MKRRYYLIVFIVLFGAALWGLFHAIDLSTPVLNPVPASTTPSSPEVPAPSTGAAAKTLTW